MIPYASEGARRGGSWTVFKAVAVAAVGAVAVSILVVWSTGYSTIPAGTPERTAALKHRAFRAQVALFKLQHNDRLPGVRPLVESGDPSDANEATFWAQMTQFADVDGYTSPTKTPRFCYGPYFQSVPSRASPSPRRPCPASRGRFAGREAVADWRWPSSPSRSSPTPTSLPLCGTPGSISPGSPGPSMNRGPCSGGRCCGLSGRPWPWRRGSWAA